MTNQPHEQIEFLRNLTLTYGVYMDNITNMDRQLSLEIGQSLQDFIVSNIKYDLMMDIEGGTSYG